MEQAKKTLQGVVRGTNAKKTGFKLDGNIWCNVDKFASNPPDTSWIRTGMHLKFLVGPPPWHNFAVKPVVVGSPEDVGEDHASSEVVHIPETQNTQKINSFSTSNNKDMQIARAVAVKAVTDTYHNVLCAVISSRSQASNIDTDEYAIFIADVNTVVDGLLANFSSNTTFVDNVEEMTKLLLRKD